MILTYSALVAPRPVCRRPARKGRPFFLSDSCRDVQEFIYLLAYYPDMDTKTIMRIALPISK